MSDTDAVQKFFQLPIIGETNLIGLFTLARKETGRFLNVYLQTLVAPVITTLLYYTVFALAFGGLNKTISGVSYMEFLAPGLIMMTMVQNAFANTSSSIVISKVQGNIVDVLMPPLSPGELLTGYVAGGLIRGLMVGFVTGVVMALVVPFHFHFLLCSFAFAFLGNMMLALLGIVGGIWSDKFDHIAAVTNFIVMPLTFLSGTFYTADSLPEFWRGLAHFNPFFYMIDGFRYGLTGITDGHVGVGLAVMVFMNTALGILALWMFRTGYKIKS